MSKSETWTPDALDPGCWYDFSDDDFVTRDNRGNWLFHDKTGRGDPIVVPDERVGCTDGRRYITALDDRDHEPSDGGDNQGDGETIRAPDRR